LADTLRTTTLFAARLPSGIACVYIFIVL
jgi:hypothetical protein